MKLLDKIQDIINKYQLKPIELNGYKNIYELIRNAPDEEKKYVTNKHDDYLCHKYHNYIPRGWYGFDIGTPIVPEWAEIIDDIVALCIEADPDFEIHQIKLKYGGIRFYTQTRTIEDLFEIELLIEDTLHDEALIY